MSVGMPAVTRFAEKRMMKDIIEMPEITYEDQYKWKVA